MVNITKTPQLIIIDLIGLHKIWAFKRQLRIPVNDIVSVYQNESELNQFKGFRFGTHIPFIITAGTYRKFDGTKNFWDVVNKKNTIIVELKNNEYSKMYLEVKNVNETINLLSI